MMKDLISVADLTTNEIKEIFALTGKLKKNKHKLSTVLKGKTLALIFQKPSTRTRVSFEVGMYHLGGNAIYLSPSEVNLGVRESVSDVAKTLSRYVDVIALRTFEHKNVVDLARYADIPVINALSDFSHPCQALADVYTVKEKLKSLKSKSLAYIGDGNNVCTSLLYACAKVGLSMRVASPHGYEPDGAVFEAARIIAETKGAKIKFYYSAHQAVDGADVIYTDVWASMGQEKEAAKREKAFKDFQVNSVLLKCAKKGVLVMHCLPAHRGKEITDQVIDSKNSIVFDQAENRLHVQKAILIKLLRG